MGFTYLSGNIVRPHLKLAVQNQLGKLKLTAQLLLPVACVVCELRMVFTFYF